MVRGDVQVSPWLWETKDYVGLAVRITVTFNNASKALTNAVVHRDTGCQFTKIVLDDPGDGVRSKRLAAPVDGAGDRTYSAGAMAAQGLSTITDVLAVQITAEP